MMGWTTQTELADAHIWRAACVLVHRHGSAAPAQADLRYRLLSAEQSSAAPLWRAIRDYLVHARNDPGRWRTLERAAYPDAVTRLSGSHTGRIHGPVPA